MEAVLTFFKNLAERRGVEIILLIISFVLVNVDSLFNAHHQDIPKVTLWINQTSGEYTQANNTLFSYPITLDGHQCYPTDLQQCVAGNPAFQNNPCCKELWNKDTAGPENTVSDGMLVFLSTFVPIIIILIRLALVRLGYLHRAPFFFTDSLLGLFFAIINVGIATNVIKFYIGRPRPCFYALQFFASYSAADFTSLVDKGYRSFPSGHASLSMAGLFYTTLLLLEDIPKLANLPWLESPLHQSLATYVAMLPTVLAAWVGLTRIRDYWHFQDDVLMGMVLGAVLAYSAFFYFSDKSVMRKSREKAYELVEVHNEEEGEEGEMWDAKERAITYGNDLPWGFV